MKLTGMTEAIFDFRLVGPVVGRAKIGSGHRKGGQVVDLMVWLGMDAAPVRFALETLEEVDGIIQALVDSRRSAYPDAPLVTE